MFCSLATVLKYVNEILVDLRVAHGHNPDVTMRFHSDDDKSFMGKLGEYALEHQWLKTTTEGYDSNGTIRSAIMARSSPLPCE